MYLKSYPQKRYWVSLMLISSRPERKRARISNRERVRRGRELFASKEHGATKRSPLKSLRKLLKRRLSELTFADCNRASKLSEAPSDALRKWSRLVISRSSR